MTPYRPLILIALGAALSAAPALAAPAPAPSVEERREARVEFLNAALNTLSARSGDVFFLPRKYNFVTGHRGRPVKTHVRQDGRLTTFETLGVTHGVPWSYDREVPLVLWGPGHIQAGRVVTRRTSQQDLAPTLARLIQAPAPSDAAGQVLAEALVSGAAPPRAVLTVVFDQGGERLFRLHPQAAPFVERLRREGTVFANTRVSHLDMETGMGHAALGTGAFPREHGLPSNDFWHGGANDGRYAFAGEGAAASPIQMLSPTLGDVWARATSNRALLLSYCYADRAAIGMGGHGSLFKGNHKPWVYWLDTKTGQLTTNPAYYTLPAYLADRVLRAPADAEARWMDHPLETPKDLLSTPRLAPWELSHLLEVIRREPFGQDDVPDLLYVSFKSTDAAGHGYGQESEEARAVLAAQDAGFARLVEALAAKVGRERLVVAFSADHGAPPLPELSGGKRLQADQLIADLNRRFDRTEDGLPTAQMVGGAQLWLDEAQLALAKATSEDVKAFLMAYEVDKERFFETVATRAELMSLERMGLLFGDERP